MFLLKGREVDILIVTFFIALQEQDPWGDESRYDKVEKVQLNQ